LYLSQLYDSATIAASDFYFENSTRSTITTAPDQMQAIALLAEELETHRLAAGEALRNSSRIKVNMG
jgi:hypothetical protein